MGISEGKEREKNAMEILLKDITEGRKLLPKSGDETKYTRS